MKRIRRSSICLMLILILLLGIVPAGLSANAKTRTVADVLGMDGRAYITWLTRHEKDSYYLGTTYRGGDYRTPHGSDGKGGAMNCTGFVWHALYKGTQASGGKTSIIPGIRGWRSFCTSRGISHRTFKSKKAMLDSGYLSKGDVIWMYINGGYTTSAYHHCGIYWGDGHTDVFWHSTCNYYTGKGCNMITEIRPILNRNITYFAIKVGGKSPLPSPEVTEIRSTAKGVKLTWDKVDGVAQYRVFVKKDGAWKSLGDTKKTSWTDKTAKNGKKYTYTVRCLTAVGKGYTSTYKKKGFSITYQQP